MCVYIYIYIFHILSITVYHRILNINNLRYADDTTLMAESEEKLKSLLMKVKVESELKHTSVKLIICSFSSQSALYFWSTDWASPWLVTQTVKNLPALQKTQVQSLDWEDPLGEDMATHPSILSWRIPWTEEPGRLWSMGSQRVEHNWVTNTFTFFLKHWLGEMCS